jgi:hypothetical protein
MHPQDIEHDADPGRHFAICIIRLRFCAPATWRRIARAANGADAQGPSLACFIQLVHAGQKLRDARDIK